MAILAGHKYDAMLHVPRTLLLTGFILMVCQVAFSQGKDDTTRTMRLPNGHILKRYYFVLLKKGAGRDTIRDTAQINRIQAGHMANMERLHKAGKLVVAGPFGDDGDWRGIFIFDCATQQETEQLLATDPAIRSGRLDYELHPWWSQQGTVLR